MLKTLPKVLVVMVMLVTFIGQAMASNIFLFCETAIEPHSPIENTELVELIDSNLIDSSLIRAGKLVDNTKDCCDIECCDIDCLCIANACSSVVYLNNERAEPNSLILSEAAYLQQFEQTNSISTLPYRPPIFTS